MEHFRVSFGVALEHLEGSCVGLLFQLCSLQGRLLPTHFLATCQHSTHPQCVNIPQL